MLVLTRKSNQSIMIGDEIEVSVLSVMGEKVRIGIQAPQKVPVFRKEIYLEIHREATGVTTPQDGHQPEKIGDRQGSQFPEQQEQADEQGCIADAGDDKGFTGGIGVGRDLVPETNEQIAA